MYNSNDRQTIDSSLETINKEVPCIKRNRTYNDRLKHHLHSLERREVRGDLIEVFRWVKGSRGYTQGSHSEVGGRAALWYSARDSGIVSSILARSSFLVKSSALSYLSRAIWSIDA